MEDPFSQISPEMPLFQALFGDFFYKKIIQLKSMLFSYLTFATINLDGISSGLSRSAAIQ